MPTDQDTQRVALLKATTKQRLIKRELGGRKMIHIVVLVVCLYVCMSEC